MKTFSTSGTGNQQTLSEIETDKVPVYDSLQDVEADLANLSVGQIVATADTGDELAQPVNVVEEGNLHAVSSNAVFENCPRFPDYTRGNIYTTAMAEITMQEDGYISFTFINTSSIGLMINNNLVSPIDVIGSTYYATFSGYVKKGDVIKRSDGGSMSSSVLKIFGLISQ